MLPSSLKGIYQQYKADTDVVAEWLAVTAIEHGYRSANSLSASNPAVKGGRLKGKARKQAKATVSGHTAAATTPDAASGTTHIVKTSDFEPMAVYIAGCSDIVIPRYFAKALSRSISVRKNFAERLGSNGVNISAESEKSHSYFIEVLEKVRHALQALLAAVPINSTGIAPAVASKTSEGLFKNLFSTLEVYQTSTEFENAPDVAPPPSITRRKYIAEHGYSAIDLIFVVTALLDDYAQLRAEIRKLWIDQAAGRLDLAAASVATNASFELARSMEDDVEPLLRDVGGTHAFIDTFFRSLCGALGVDPLAKKEPRDPYNLEAYDVADTCFINTLTLLSSFTAATDPDAAFLQDYNGKFGWYDEALDRSTQTNRQKWKQDMTAVLELMPDLSFMVYQLDRLSVVDELTRGLAYMMDDPHRPTPLWLAFAVQVYLDILQAFGQTCDGLGAMQSESRRIKQSMLDVPTSSRSEVLRAAGLWDDDPLWAARKLAVEAEMLPSVRSPPFQFLRRNPMYCGLLVQNMRATVQNAGMPYAATPGALVGVVQLYHALRHEELLAKDCVWDDLLTLWTLQGNASFFVGDLPTTKEAYFKNYCLSIGTSATHWVGAQNRRKGKEKVKIHSDNRRNLMPMGYLSLAINHRLEHPGARVPWSCATLEELLGTAFAQRYTDSRSHLRPEFKTTVEQAKKRFAELPPAKILREVAEAIQHEKQGLCFNLFTIHNEAWLFLEMLQTALAPILGNRAAGNAADPARTLPFVSGLCFAAAAGKTLDHSQTVVASDTLLRAAANVLQIFVQAGHGSIIKNAAKDVDPPAVESLRQGLGLWRLDRMKPFGKQRGLEGRGQRTRELETLLQMLRPN